jgi:hypothetical protein
MPLIAAAIPASTAVGATGTAGISGAHEPWETQHQTDHPEQIHAKEQDVVSHERAFPVDVPDPVRMAELP